MSREPKRMEENVRGSSRLIVYIAVATIIGIVILSYAIIANMIRNNKEEQRLAEIESQEKQAEEQTIEFEIAEIESNEESESVSTQMGKTVEESSKESKEVEENTTVSSTNSQKENSSTEIENIGKAIKNKAEESITNETVSSDSQKEKELTFVMPVDGEIIKGFAKDSLVYSETLQEWIVHQAIDIKANSRDVVKAAAEGTVTAIKNDPRYGLTVIIEHEGGFKTVYSNLLTAEFVVEGEKVKQGQTLGTVGSSATFEIADEPHLHFEMLKDSEYVDPTVYVK